MTTRRGKRLNVDETEMRQLFPERNIRIIDPEANFTLDPKHLVRPGIHRRDRRVVFDSARKETEKGSVELKTGDIVFDSLHNTYIVAYIAETPKLGPEDADSFTSILGYCLLKNTSSSQSANSKNTSKAIGKKRKSPDSQPAKEGRKVGNRLREVNDVVAVGDASEDELNQLAQMLSRDNNGIIFLQEDNDSSGWEWLRGLCDMDEATRMNAVTANLRKFMDEKVQEKFSQPPEKMSESAKAALDEAIRANEQFALTITTAEMTGKASDVPDDIARKFPWHLRAYLLEEQRQEPMIQLGNKTPKQQKKKKQPNHGKDSGGRGQEVGGGRKAGCRPYRDVETGKTHMIPSDMSVEEYLKYKTNMKVKAGSNIIPVNDERRQARFALLEEDLADKKEMLKTITQENKELEKQLHDMKVREIEWRSAFSQVCMVTKNTAYTCSILNQNIDIDNHVANGIASIKVPLDVDGSKLE